MRCTGENPDSSTLGQTLAVIALLILAAAVFSYLWAYALNDALVAGLIKPPMDGNSDPRPEQMKQAFAMIVSVLLVCAALMKWSSARQIRRIDAMNRE